MKLFSLFLTVSLISALIDALSSTVNTSNTSPTSNTTLLTFDSFSTTRGLAALPSPYHHLLFSAFLIFAPRDPAFQHLISPHDHNCATSAPNALFGCCVLEEGFPNPSIAIANATSMAAAGLLPFFSLVSFTLKPMDAPDVGTTVYVKGYTVGGGEPLEWKVEFPLGYHLPFRVELAKHSRDVWERLERVEMWAEYGEDGLDWEFCVDDLEVRFFEAVEGHDRLVHQEGG
ncbi:hypothetical protein MMC17_009220 [Xylographa soralifera]|nr:hypothetical protein [Xylographa soralifera]